MDKCIILIGLLVLTMGFGSMFKDLSSVKPNIIKIYNDTHRK